MNAVLYRRVSTDQQALSMETQESLPVAYCERMGLHILVTFEDEDTSGSIPMKQREPDFGGAGMMTFLHERKGESIAVVCLNQDRLGRDTIDQIQTIREIWALGHIPHLVNE